MNQFGLNSAAINGNAYGFIAGAALVTVICSIDAAGTRNQCAQATVSVSTVVQADSIRNVFGQVPVIGIQPAVSAQWAILTPANANFYANATLAATPTDAYFAGIASIAASGFITRPGRGQASVGCSLSATPLVTVGYAANVNPSIQVSADASVKLNGTSNWLRDGYALPIACSGLIAANGLRTAQGFAVVAGTSDTKADSIKTHGGAAMCSVSSVMSAAASTDAANINVSVQVSASGLITRLAQAAISPQISVSATHIAILQGAAERANSVVNVIAEGRLAELGSASIVGKVNMSADAIFGQLGEANFNVYGSMLAAPNIYKYAEGTVAGNAQVSATGLILKLASAFVSVLVDVKAVPSTNSQVPAPDSRSMYVAMETRGMIIPFEDRSMRISS